MGRGARHAEHTEAILARIGAFSELARVAGGAPRAARRQAATRAACSADEISLETRIITTADIFDAISADRPYRAAVPVPETLATMAGMVGTAIDPLCFDALRHVIGSDRAA